MSESGFRLRRPDPPRAADTFRPWASLVVPAPDFKDSAGVAAPMIDAAASVLPDTAPIAAPEQPVAPAEPDHAALAERIADSLAAIRTAWEVDADAVGAVLVQRLHAMFEMLHLDVALSDDALRQRVVALVAMLADEHAPRRLKVGGQSVFEALEALMVAGTRRDGLDGVTLVFDPDMVVGDLWLEAGDSFAEDRMAARRAAFLSALGDGAA